MKFYSGQSCPDLALNREEMEHDENIEKKNMEVVDFVKESIQ